MSHCASPERLKREMIKERLNRGWKLADAQSQPRIPIFKYGKFADWESIFQKVWNEVNSLERP